MKRRAAGIPLSGGGANLFDVYGPAGFVDWFVTLADAKECAEGQSEKVVG
jgi:hypothetical protein